jgi:hypothetical protein
VLRIMFSMNELPIAKRARILNLPTRRSADLTLGGGRFHYPGTWRPSRIRRVCISEGAVAQLGERRVRNAKVRGSIPLGSTNPSVPCRASFRRCPRIAATPDDCRSLARAPLPM